MSGATQIPPEDPEQLGRVFAARAGTGDLEGMLALYEDTATFVGPDSVSASGRQEIRLRLKELLAMAPQITTTGSNVVLAGDIALMSIRWTMRLGVLDRDAPSVDGQSTEVARRQPDGGWLYVIDNPAVIASSEAQ